MWKLLLARCLFAASAGLLECGKLFEHWYSRKGADGDEEEAANSEGGGSGWGYGVVSLVEASLP